MRKVVLLLLLAIAGVVTWYFFVTKPKPNDETPQLQPLSVSKYPAAFNNSINNALARYYTVSEALVAWDSVAVAQKVDSLSSSLSAINFEAIKGDTAIYETAQSYKNNFTADVDAIKNEKNITAKRRAFNSLSQNMYDLLRTVKWDGGKVFLQSCPMAFNDTETALWLSKSGSDEERRNPYLGLHHPKYKSGMLACGETKDSLNFK